MNYNFIVALLLTFVTTILCLILIYKLFQLIRSSIVWRVNCWFCNSNYWVKYVERNCWTCPGCEQYNGFTKDGDYNKTVLIVQEKIHKSVQVFAHSPPRNGLCKMCNVNQQLKVTQLANFVPTSDKNFESEIEIYRAQLEKAYKLCSPCKKVLLTKLNKEKESLLGSKLLEERTPKNKLQNKQNSKNKVLEKIITRTSIFAGILLLLLVSIECYQNINKIANISSTLYSIINIVKGLSERLFVIISLKLKTTFPSIKELLDMNILYDDFQLFTNKMTINEFEEINALTQEVIGGFVCFIQIIGHIFNSNKTKYNILRDLLWTMFEVASIIQHSKIVSHVSLTLIKFLSICLVLIVYKINEVKNYKNVMYNRLSTSPNHKKFRKPITMKDFANNSEENSAMETDDDVSLYKFGLHNLTDSSADTNSLLNNSFINGRSFTPRSDSLWSKPKMNSTFCINSMTAKSPSCVSETIFAKPSFDKYQKLHKEDSDSDLDESISSLTIGTPKKLNHKNNSMFSLRKFTATPSFVAPTALNRSRPLISPSKLGHNTSWVAGGYWGSDGEHQIFNINGSRSSSQSSGFESQASSLNQRNIFSQPPSREESVCGDSDRTTVLLDPFQGCNLNNLGGYLAPQGFSPISTPIYPQMQFNNHVQIPQPRFAQNKNITHNAFTRPSFVQNSIFKAPGGSGIINLSRVNSFTH